MACARVNLSSPLPFRRDSSRWLVAALINPTGAAAIFVASSRVSTLELLSCDINKKIEAGKERLVPIERKPTGPWNRAPTCTI